MDLATTIKRAIYSLMDFAQYITHLTGISALSFANGIEMGIRTLKSDKFFA